MEVQCRARTSGLQTGRILPALTSVKIYGRASPSHTYQVSGNVTPSTTLSPGVSSSHHIPQQHPQKHAKSPHPLGIPGDSGAWVIDRRNGRLAGHILAWSERKQVAYICPMDILLLDIAETLEATEVRLPGGEAIIRLREGAAIAAAVAASTVSRWDYVNADMKEAGEDCSELDSLTEADEENGVGKEHSSQLKLAMPAPRRSPPPPPPPPKDDCYDAASVRTLAADMEKVHIPNSEIEVGSR